MHHQRTPRTPESYFNVPESIALLNIVKSERIQCAFQSNRKNHASVWEMVANILNKYSQRKRSAKQCCNRYENLKKIYTQLKRNPEKHVRRNWPYMYLFREIEEQRGESWGTNGKKNTTNYPLNAVTKNAETSSQINFNIHEAQSTSDEGLYKLMPSADTNDKKTYESKKNEISFFQKCRNVSAITSMLLNREVMLTNISNNQTNNKDLLNCSRLVADNFVETELNCEDEDMENNEEPNDMGIDLSSFGLDNFSLGRNKLNLNKNRNAEGSTDTYNNIKRENNLEEQDGDKNNKKSSSSMYNKFYRRTPEVFLNDPQNTQYFHHLINETNMLNPDGITNTQSDDSLSADDYEKQRPPSENDDSLELIEHLKRRERLDAEMLKQMHKREERLLLLLERAVVAIEKIVDRTSSPNKNIEKVDNISADASHYKKN